MTVVCVASSSHPSALPTCQRTPPPPTTPLLTACWPSSGNNDSSRTPLPTGLATVPATNHGRRRRNAPNGRGRGRGGGGGGGGGGPAPPDQAHRHPLLRRYVKMDGGCAGRECGPFGFAWGALSRGACLMLPSHHPPFHSVQRAARVLRVQPTIPVCGLPQVAEPAPPGVVARGKSVCGLEREGVDAYPDETSSRHHFFF